MPITAMSFHKITTEIVAFEGQKENRAGNRPTRFGMYRRFCRPCLIRQDGQRGWRNGGFPGLEAERFLHAGVVAIDVGTGLNHAVIVDEGGEISQVNRDSIRQVDPFFLAADHLP